MDDRPTMRMAHWWLGWSVQLVVVLVIGLFFWGFEFGCSGEIMDSGHDLYTGSSRAHFCRLIGQTPNSGHRSVGLFLLAFTPALILVAWGLPGLTRRRPRLARASLVTSAAVVILLIALFEMLGTR